MGKFDLGGFGTQAAQGLLGAGLGLLLQKGQDRRQIRQQEKLQSLEIAGQKQMTDYNFKKQLEMWEATGYSGQKRQLQEAGLNPGLMYGMGGGGGQTADVSGGNVSGGHASGHSGEAMGMAMMMGQLGLMKAQKANIEADTANKNADTANKPLVGENIIASTASLYEGINSQKAQQALAKAQESLAGSQDSLVKRLEWEAWNTQDARVQEAIAKSKSAVENAKQELIQTGLDAATVDEKIKIMEAEAAGKVIYNALMASQTDANRSMIEKNKQEIYKMGQEILQNWEKLSLEDRKTLIIERVGKFNSSQSQRTYENILNGVNTVSGIFKPIGVGGTPTRNPIGFNIGN